MWFVVVGAGDTPAAAMDALAGPAAALDGVLDARSAALRDRSTSALSVQPVVEHDPRTGRARTTGYEATRATTCVVADLGALAALVREAVDEAGARLGGPVWRIGADDPVHDEVRAAAAADARRRAEASARGLGLAVGAVEWVLDPVLRSGGGGGPVMPRMAMAAAAPVGAGAVDVAPGRVTVTASVDVGFRLLA